MNPKTDNQVIVINHETIKLPDWLPRQAVDKRTGAGFDEYWEMVAEGSIVLSPEQLKQALEIGDKVEKLLGKSSDNDQ